MLNVTADSLPRLMRCIGSRLMEPAFPALDKDRTARAEGIAADYMANAVFRNEYTIEELIDRKAPNGVYMSAEMADHVAEYLSALDCGEVQADTSFGTDAFRVGARCDHRKYRIEIDTLTIDDLKYGHSIVEPEMNWTLIAHAVGTCAVQQITPANIVLRIHQPRAWHPEGKVREWRLTYIELMTLYGQIAAKLTNPTDELVTDVNLCRRCPALGHCPAARKANMNAIDAMETTAFVDTIPDDALSYELIMLANAEATIKNRAEALRELAIHRIKNGKIIPEFANETQRANTRWKSGFDATLVSAITGVDVTTKPGIVTPAEAGRRGVSEAVLKSMTERPITGTKLTRVNTDKRAKRLLNKES
jgi:hypothetical protein